MALFFKIYISCWSTACLIALLIIVNGWKSYDLSRKEYWQFIFKPWRLTTFIIAASGMIVIAPYTGDPTWDYFDAFFMSVFTYFSAPWVMGVLYKVSRRKLNPSQAFVALCVWMFSASWSYDIYLVFRDGYYPITWFSNIFASSVLYVSGGLFWSLDWVAGRGATFGFMEDGWPYSTSGTGFLKILLYLLPFMVLVSIIILSFLWN